MSKKRLKFDAGQLKQFCDIYSEQPIDDGYGGTIGVGMELLFSPRCKRNIKTKTSQSQVQAGAFDLYQVYEFIIRDDPRFVVTKNMEIISDGATYVIKGITPLESNPNYILITTSTKE